MQAARDLLEPPLDLSSSPYRHGINWSAIVALVVAVAPVLPGFIRAASTPGGRVMDPFWIDSLYTYAWFVTFALGSAVYLLLTWAGHQRAPDRLREAGGRGDLAERKMTA